MGRPEFRTQPVFAVRQPGRNPVPDPRRSDRHPAGCRELGLLVPGRGREPGTVPRVRLRSRTRHGAVRSDGPAESRDHRCRLPAAVDRRAQRFGLQHRRFRWIGSDPHHPGGADSGDLPDPQGDVDRRRRGRVPAPKRLFAPGGLRHSPAQSADARVSRVVAGRLIAAQILALTALAILPSPASSHPHDTQDSTATAALDSADAVPQRDFGDLARVILRRPVRTDVVEELRPGLSLTVLPSVGYNAAYGAYAGASVSLGGWLGNPRTTSLSSGAAGATYSTEGQLSIQFRSDFYLPDDQWALKLDWRYLDTSQPTYGLGPSHPHRPEYPMDFVLYRL